MCKQPGNDRVLTGVLATLALATTILLNDAASAEVSAHITESPTPGTEWKPPLRNHQTTAQEIGRKASNPGLGYPYYKQNRLRIPTTRENNNLQPTFGDIDRHPEKSANMLDPRAVGTHHSRYWRGRPGYGPRSGGYGYGYPGFRGHGGSSYPHHRAYGTPPLHLPNAGNKEKD